MKQVSLSGSSRTNVGKTDAKATRVEGFVPGVIYGGSEQKFVSLAYAAIENIIYSPDTYQVNLEVDGKTFPSIIREVQYHPVTDKIMHVDFIELVDGKDIRVDIPIKLLGNSTGVRQGGKLSKSLRKLTVKANPKHIPDYISVNIESLDLGQTLKVKDITVPNVTILNSPNSAVASVKTTRNVVEAAPAAGATAAKPAAAAPAAAAKPAAKK